MLKLHTVAAAATLAIVGSAHALTPTQIDAARAAGTIKEVHVAGSSGFSTLSGLAPTFLLESK